MLQLMFFTHSAYGKENFILLFFRSFEFSLILNKKFKNMIRSPIRERK